VEIKTSIQVVIGVEVKPNYSVGDHIQCRCGGKPTVIHGFCGVEGKIIDIDERGKKYIVSWKNIYETIKFEHAHKRSRLEEILK
jgi:hypothetical protein